MEIPREFQNHREQKEKSLWQQWFSSQFSWVPYWQVLHKHK